MSAASHTALKVPSLEAWPVTRTGLYGMVDVDACRGRSPLWLAEEILDGGCVALQLRAKHATDRRRLELARAIRARCVEARVPFIINDRVDLAVLCKADALHLGQDDLSLDEARAIAPSMPIGVSTHDLSQLRKALTHPIAYVAFGPVFPTASKANPDAIVGLQRLREAVVLAGSTPLVAIGGIRLESADEIRATGASMGAVIGEVAAAADPASTARELHRLLGGRVP